MIFDVMDSYMKDVYSQNISKKEFELYKSEHHYLAKEDEES